MGVGCRVRVIPGFMFSRPQSLHRCVRIGLLLGATRNMSIATVDGDCMDRKCFSGFPSVVLARIIRVVQAHTLSHGRSRRSYWTEIGLTLRRPPLPMVTRTTSWRIYFSSPLHSFPLFHRTQPIPTDHDLRQLQKRIERTFRAALSKSGSHVACVRVLALVAMPNP